MDQLPMGSLSSDDANGFPERPLRRQVLFPAHLVMAGGVVLDVRVVDLSYDGCQIEVSKFLFEGDEVRLSVQGRGAIVAKVRWCKDGRAGLFFASETPSREEVARNAERRPATMEAQLRRIGHLSYTVNVRDISPEGCQVDLVERPALGEIMQVKLPGLATMEARVRWIDDYVAGLKFARPIHPAVFDLLLDRLGR